ncbi:Cof-type HAD-IIB family hydrolase [Holdemanella porci]|uniref:HAD family hydrolase n=1 Tax=Holdemanella porci TaxID=2652276 RepID=UPI001D157386|nr:HAD family hydrolase [Holdemanella porci]MCC3360082.1 Cof-type HAD-IIB family hydrolase [Holdemanella porci]
MVKIIAFDLDGTLYDKHKHIDEDTIHKIIDFEQKGIVVGIVTGRFYEELDEVIEKLKLREYNGFVASSNGLEIHDFLDGKIKCFTRLSKDEVKELIEEAKKHHMISYVWQNGRYSMFDISFMNGLKKLASVIPFNVHYIRALRETEFEKSISLEVPLYDKVCFAGLPILKLKKSILKQHPEYRFYDVGRLGTELCKKDVGKLEAIQFICRKKNTSIDCVMAFGDNGNDVNLLASCGYGVAMRNGSAQAKKAAKYISDYTNNEQGVLRFINSFFG